MVGMPFFIFVSHFFKKHLVVSYSVRTFESTKEHKVFIHNQNQIKMKTIYFTTSGQNIRQQQDLGNNTIIIKRKVIQSRLIDARSSFTNKNFDVSLEGLKETAKEWAYNPDLLKFDVSHEVIETPKQSHVGEYERQLASAEATVETFIVKL